MPSADAKASRPFGTVRTQDGLEASRGSSIRILVFEDRRMAGVSIDSSDLATDDNNVVGLRSSELVQSQLGFAPVDAIVALRIAAVEWMRVGLTLPGGCTSRCHAL